MSARQSVATVLTLMVISAASMSALTHLAYAQPAPGPQHPGIASLLNLDATRAAQVEAILQASHEKRIAMMDALRLETDAQLATVLTAEEFSKLKEALPTPPGPGEGMRRRGTAM